MTKNHTAKVLYRVEMVDAVTGKRELWSNYLDQRGAEEAAYGLITSGHAHESEVFTVTDARVKTSIYRAKWERDGAILVRRNAQ